MPLIPDDDRPRRRAHHAGMIPDAERPGPDVLVPDVGSRPGKRHDHHLHKARDVARALASDRALLDAEYRSTVVRAYLDHKLTHHAKADVGGKLRHLEAEFPEYADTFEAVRAAYGLPLGLGEHSPRSWFSRSPRVRSRVPSSASLHADDDDVFACHGAGAGQRLEAHPPAYTPAAVLAPLDVNATIAELQRRLEAEAGARRAAERRLGELGVDVPPAPKADGA
ncbi:hypothetical protein Q8F55_008351 [Vanrija albida]|uniref:Uncharacterized protein n=1 Tax=Vanrija albida TaxID=181172 RepID=A0ABR3PW43_9TREE